MLTVRDIRNLLSDKLSNQQVVFVLEKMKTGRKIRYPLLSVEEEPNNNVVTFILADKDKNVDKLTNMKELD